MAEFGNTQVEGMGQTHAPLAPVVNEAPLVAAQGIANLAGTGASIFAGVQEQKATTATNTALAAYEQEQLKLSEAVEQGKLSQAAAATRWRKNHLQFVTNNPKLGAEFRDLSAKLGSDSLLGGIVKTGTKEEQAQQKNTDEATAAGWITPNMNKTQSEMATQQYMNLKLTEEKMAREKRALEFESAQVGLDKGKLELLNARRKETSQANVSNYAQQYSSKFNNQMATVQGMFERGEIDRAQAVAMVTQEYNQVDSVLTMSGKDAGGEYLTNLASPFTNMRDLTLGFINGSIKRDAYKAQTDNAMALAQYNMMKDPMLVRYAAASAVFKDASLISLAGMSSKVSDYFKNGNDPTTKPYDATPDTPEAKKDFGTYLNTTREVANKYNSGNSVDPERTKVELGNQVHTLLKSVDAYSNSVENPAEYNQAVEFLADPAIGKFIATNGVPADVASNARYVLGEQYETVVRDVIKKEFESATVGIKQSISNQFTGGLAETENTLTSLVEPVWNGSGVVFRPKAGVKLGAESLTKVKRLNDKGGKLLNRLIRMDAHLSGTTNYKQSFDNNYASLFGIEQDTNNK